ncbi:MAG TPA: 5'-3' exonuclease H3TH domain-containing protein [Acidobacteriota bacterium]|nr:5'-3' exonuclease H3TH domain-containing protein [Acidobacteriota bacterium]
MQVHLVDATYELFRHYYGAPKRSDPQGREVGATVGLIRSLAKMLREEGATHVGCAFDHVIESFRNQLFEGYKTGEGIDPDLRSQFELAEQACRALGLVVWPGVELEADDLMASAARRYVQEEAVDRILLCSTDKDLAQCVEGTRIVCLDRRRGLLIDEEGVRDKFGVGPESIPDYLALVGDSADGIPGIPRWGAKSAAAVLSRYLHLEDIPERAEDWEVTVRGASSLAENLAERRPQALLYKRLATLRYDAPIQESLHDLEWRGARRKPLESLCRDLDSEAALDLIPRWQNEE